jgi:hypothetical protein
MNKTLLNQIGRHVKNNDVVCDGNIAMACIDLSKVYIDDEHPHRQPRFNKERVNKIAEEWDIKKAGAINVFYRPGGPSRIFALGNGNHRYEAAILKGVPYLPATILANLDEQQECETVKGWNKQKAFTATDNFRADLKSGNPFTKKIQDIVTNNKFRLDVSKTSRTKMEQTNANSLKCYVMLQQIAEYDNGFELLDRTLKTIYKCNKVEGTRRGVIEKEALKDNYIFAIASALKVCEGDRTLIKKIEDALLSHENGAAGIVTAAQNKYDRLSSGNRSPAIRKYILDISGIAEELEEEMAA